MSIYYQDERVTLYHGDCLEVLRSLPDASVDSVVTDPPYGLEFMGKDWDRFATGRGAKYAKGGDLDPENIAERSGKGGAGPSYVNRPAKRCALCGKQSWSGSPCVCPEPQWIMDNSPLHSFQAWCELWTAECLRVLKPGGHMLAFGGTRTWHRLACAVEDAGFEVRDSIAWLHSQGFPKSLDVSKAIDKRRDWSLVERLADEIRRARAEAGLSLAEIGQATLDATDGTYGKWYHRGGHMFFETGRSLPSRPEWEHLRHVLPIAPEFAEVYDEAEREITGHHDAGNPIGLYEHKHGEGNGRTAKERRDIPATPDAERWQGWGTALKPAFEPVVVARKPLAGTVASNVLQHGTGALNIDGCRIETTDSLGGGANVAMTRETRAEGWGRPWMEDDDAREQAAERSRNNTARAESLGRWPTNVVLDDSQAEALDQMSGDRPGFATQNFHSGTAGKSDGWGNIGALPGETRAGYNDQGGASRFFYTAKADSNERPRINGVAHPTVKPLDLMRWLVRLVTPPGGTVLEPFAGSGTTVEACIIEGFRCIAIEREADYLPLITQRIHRRLDPLEAVRQAGGDLGLFDFGEPA